MESSAATADGQRAAMPIDHEELKPADVAVDGLNDVDMSGTACEGARSTEAAEESAWPSAGERMPHGRFYLLTLVPMLALTLQSLTHSDHLPSQVPRRQYRRVAS